MHLLTLVTTNCPTYLPELDDKLPSWNTNIDSAEVHPQLTHSFVIKFLPIILISCCFLFFQLHQQTNHPLLCCYQRWAIMLELLRLLRQKVMQVMQSDKESAIVLRYHLTWSLSCHEFFLYGNSAVWHSNHQNLVFVLGRHLHLKVHNLFLLELLSKGHSKVPLGSMFTQKIQKINSKDKIPISVLPFRPFWWNKFLRHKWISQCWTEVNSLSVLSWNLQWFEVFEISSPKSLEGAVVCKKIKSSKNHITTTTL